MTIDSNEKCPNWDLGGKIAYLLGKSEAFGQPKWTTVYLVSQIINVVIEHLKSFPKEDIVSPVQHELLIRYVTEHKEVSDARP